MKFIRILILPAIICLFSCQSNSIFKDCKGYHDFINLAELAIIRDDFQTAKIAYKKAFQCPHPGFTDDFFNALKVSILCQDMDFSYENAEKLARLGICEDFFNQFDWIRKDSIKWANLMVLIEQKSNVNHEYREILEDMFNEDQSIRGDRSKPERIENVDSLNYQLFKELVQRYGYPTAHNIGIECSNNLRGIQYLPQEVMLTHFSQRKYLGIDTLLLEAWRDKKICPHICADYLELFGYTTKHYPVPVVKIEGALYTFRMSDSLRNIVNENRKEFGMESIEDHILKIKYKLDHQETNFRFFTSIHQFPMFSQQWVDTTFIKLEW